MTPRPVLAVSAVAVQDDDLLLVRRGREPNRGLWALPGGRVEHGEALAEAVTRELLEETGLEGLCGPLLGRVERIADDGHHVILAFEVTVMSMDQPVAGDDAAEVAWVPLHEVAERPLVDGVAELLHDHGIIATFT